MMLERLIEIANEKYDGHFTLLKFTRNWRCCFGTIQDRLEIDQMAEGETMEEAIDECITKDVNVYAFKF